MRGDSLNGLMNVQRVCQLLTDLFLMNLAVDFYKMFLSYFGRAMYISILVEIL